MYSIDYIYQHSRLVYPNFTDVVVIPPKLTNTQSYQEYWNGIKDKVSCIVNLTQEITGDDNIKNFYYNDQSLFYPVTDVENIVDPCYIILKQLKQGNSKLNLDLFRSTDPKYENLTLLHISNLQEAGVIVNTKKPIPFTDFDILRLLIFMKLAFEYSVELNKRRSQKDKLPILIHCNQGVYRTSFAITLLLLIYYGKSYPNQIPELLDTILHYHQPPYVLNNNSIGEKEIYIVHPRTVEEIAVQPYLKKFVNDPKYQQVIVRLSSESYSESCYNPSFPSSLFFNVRNKMNAVCWAAQTNTQNKCPRKFWVMRNTMTLYIELIIPTLSGNSISLIIQKNLYDSCNRYQVVMTLNTNNDFINLKNEISCNELSKQLSQTKTPSGTPYTKANVKSDYQLGYFLTMLTRRKQVNWQKVFNGEISINYRVCCGNTTLLKDEI